MVFKLFSCIIIKILPYRFAHVPHRYMFLFFYFFVNPSIFTKQNLLRKIREERKKRKYIQEINMGISKVEIYNKET